MYQAGELPKALRVSKIHYEPPKTVCKTPFASIFPPSMENGDGTRLQLLKRALKAKIEDATLKYLGEAQHVLERRKDYLSNHSSLVAATKDLHRSRKTARLCLYSLVFTIF